MKPFFFFDLDGPILDVSEKYYRVYADLMAEKGFDYLDKDQYWNRKREKVPEIETLSLSQAQDYYSEYNVKRLKRIEADKYMKYDELQPGALKALEVLGPGYQLVLVTMRSFKTQLIKQLRSFGICEKFDEILCTGQQSPHQRWRAKYQIILDHWPQANFETSYFIGDTETDIFAAKELGCTSIAVLNGLSDSDHIHRTQPNFILEGTKDLFSIIGLN